MKRDYAKILDVNFNRAKEGLRVVEEILRFIIRDKKLTQAAKSARHRLTAILNKCSITEYSLNRSRDIAGDPGKKATYLEKKSGLDDLFFSNIHRTEEALRVLEEISALFDFNLFRQFKALRFKVYSLEKASVRKLKVLSNR